MVDSIRKYATPKRLALTLFGAYQGASFCLAVPLAIALWKPVLVALGSCSLPVLLAVHLKRKFSARRAYRAAVTRRLAWA